MLPITSVKGYQTYKLIDFIHDFNLGKKFIEKPSRREKDRIVVCD